MNKVSCQVTVGVDVAGIDVSSTGMKCSLPCLMVVFVDLSFVLVSLLHIRSSNKNPSILQRKFGWITLSFKLLKQ